MEEYLRTLKQMEDRLKILTMLDNGINPLTGEKLQEDILYQLLPVKNYLKTIFVKML